MKKGPVLWYDVTNPSDVWFFAPFIRGLCDFETKVTLRDRAETVFLARSIGLHGEVIGTHYTDKLQKNIGAPWRMAQLYLRVRGFDIGLFFENGLAVTVARLKGRHSLLFCDNDLKLLRSRSFIQDLENRVKFKTDRLVIPEASLDIFLRRAPEEIILTYDGYKEDIYIADFAPNPSFVESLPFKDFVVVRPEALDSSYVSEQESIVPSLLSLLRREGLNVVYLPRERWDLNYAVGTEVYVPSQPLNGLDLCYYSRAVLTGSGTMAREAACMGKPAVSFFPGRELLSVDRKLVSEGRMFHSRDPEEICQYVLSLPTRLPPPDFDRARRVKTWLLKRIRELVEEIGPV